MSKINFDPKISAPIYTPIEQTKQKASKTTLEVLLYKKGLAKIEDGDKVTLGVQIKGEVKEKEIAKAIKSEVPPKTEEKQKDAPHIERLKKSYGKIPKESKLKEFRARNLDGRFRGKRGDTTLATLQQTYGKIGGGRWSGDTKLSQILKETGYSSLTELLKHRKELLVNPKLPQILEPGEQLPHTQVKVEREIEEPTKSSTSIPATITDLTTEEETQFPSTQPPVAKKTVSSVPTTITEMPSELQSSPAVQPQQVSAGSKYAFPAYREDTALPVPPDTGPAPSPGGGFSDTFYQTPYFVQNFLNARSAYRRGFSEGYYSGINWGYVPGMPGWSPWVPSYPGPMPGVPGWSPELPCPAPLPGTPLPPCEPFSTSPPPYPSLVNTAGTTAPSGTNSALPPTPPQVQAPPERFYAPSYGYTGGSYAPNYGYGYYPGAYTGSSMFIEPYNYGWGIGPTIGMGIGLGAMIGSSMMFMNPYNYGWGIGPAIGIGLGTMLGSSMFVNPYFYGWGGGMGSLLGGTGGALIGGGLGALGGGLIGGPLGAIGGGLLGSVVGGIGGSILGSTLDWGLSPWYWW